MTNLEKYYDEIVKKVRLYSRIPSDKLSTEDAVFVAVAIIADEHGFEHVAHGRSEEVMNLLKWMKESAEEGQDDGRD